MLVVALVGRADEIGGIAGVGAYGIVPAVGVKVVRLSPTVFRGVRGMHVRRKGIKVFAVPGTVDAIGAYLIEDPLPNPVEHGNEHFVLLTEPVQEVRECILAGDGLNP